LNRRERTVDEVRRHLIGRGIGEVSTEAAIAELTQRGYLDDARFARLFVQDKRELEQWGSERIRRGLQARGVDRELVAEALAADGTKGEDAERAFELLQHRCPDPPRDRRERERALGLLLRRGYPYEVASKAVSRHLSYAPAASEDC
jgi:regulatory protein